MSDPDLDAAYRLQTPEDSVRLYRDWSQSYDAGFAQAQGYLLPAAVADAFAEAGGAAPVLDVGAGTGLLAARLAEHGIGPIDALDISPEMLALAASKGVYRASHCLDLTQPLPLADASYVGVTSSGTFTFGHVGPAAFDELLRIAAPGALFALSIHTGVFEPAGFAAKLAELGGAIAGLMLTEVAIYGPDADTAHRDHRGLIARFRKA
ncbi:MAG: methyltransferase domain-containing protein [Rhodobacteraceae bacterium]|nr:methyltransferase domain-containing protein [Paracoccaceae bacterium]